MESNNREQEVAGSMQSLQQSEIQIRNNDGEDTVTPEGRKKYHSSALYAASLWHHSVNHVRPVHRPIER